MRAVLAKGFLPGDDPGAVHGGGDLAHMGFCRGDGVLDRCLVGDVGFHEGCADVAGNGLATGAVAVEDGDLCALIAEMAGRGLAQSGGASGDDRGGVCHAHGGSPIR